MGEYLLYVYGKGIGGIYDDRFLIKRTVPGEALLPHGREALPYPGAKPMLLVEEVDDREFYSALSSARTKRCQRRKSAHNEEFVLSGGRVKIFAGQRFLWLWL